MTSEGVKGIYERGHGTCCIRNLFYLFLLRGCRDVLTFLFYCSRCGTVDCTEKRKFDKSSV